MAARVSRGCLRCRTRRVKCDEGRPSCRRCIQRSEVCEGYRDDSTLLFRSENERVARKVITRQTSDHDLGPSTVKSTAKASHSFQNRAPRKSSTHTSPAADPSDLPAIVDSTLKLSSPYPWAKSVPDAALPSVEDIAVNQFFEKYIMYPCNQGSSPGFLEHLPSLFREFRNEGRLALRWAVLGAAYAGLSNDQDNATFGNKALQYYGMSLSALADALKANTNPPDDFCLMTVVILDIFETVYLRDQPEVGSHAVGIAQLLRLRGPNQIYGARGWSLFRLSHHRIQMQQLVSKLPILPESDTWLHSLNEDITEVRIEKDNHKISKFRARGRELLQRLNEGGACSNEIVDMVKETHDLDQTATTWRAGPDWAYKIIHRSQIAHCGDIAFQLPEFVQLHRDVWIAYEWNYHRTARILLHENLLNCLDRLDTIYSEKQEVIPVDSASLRETSVSTIQYLVDEVISTVPQMLGDIDNEGKIMSDELGRKICKGIGGYFLLWPIRVIKSSKYALQDQIETAQTVFERVRECTGMKSVLGEASSIGR